MANAIVWADIPVVDLDRARKFYGEILQVEIQVMPGSEAKVAVPPPESGPVAFDLAEGMGKPSSTEGVTVYLNSGGDIDAMVKRVEASGGKIIQQPTDMGEMIGKLAYFIDTEGNRIGIQQPPANMPQM